MKQIKKDIQVHYFSKQEIIADSVELGSLELRPSYPFIVSGGRNTERYYFKHVSKITDYKFNVRPEYFGDESSYVDVFPERIKRILAEDSDAKIFCVFDWDTVYDNETNLKKHKLLERRLKKLLDAGRVVFCPSMPSIEYWFLLHFENRTNLMITYGKVNNRLGPHLKPLLEKLYEKNALPSIGKFLKKEKFLENDGWVKALCEGGKLETAIKNAEQNIVKAKESNCLDEESYSFVYQAFKN